MTSVGVMASAVVSGVCTDVLREPFDNLAAWTAVGTATVVTGRTGTAAQITNSGTTLSYDISTANQNAIITLGFAIKWSHLGVSEVLTLRSDAGATRHNVLQLNSNGSLTFARDTTTLVSSAAGVVTTGTFYYLEVQAKLDDTTGSVTVRLNGTPVITATGLDTKFGGTKTVYDEIRFSMFDGRVNIIDDLYLSAGDGCSFKGDQTIVNTGPDVLLEPFNNLTAWTVTGTPTGIVAGGRTGTAAEFASFSSTFISYAIPTPAQSDTITIGFAFRPSAIGVGEYKIIGLASDAGATDHNTLAINSTNALVFYRSSSGLLTSANGVIPAANTYYYIEVQAKLHDTTGTFEVRVNGTPVIGPATAQDTKNAGTKTVYDTVRLPPSGFNGAIVRYDDLYITMGAGAPFKGAITIP
jgi:hypothetical protein